MREALTGTSVNAMISVSPSNGVNFTVRSCDIRKQRDPYWDRQKASGMAQIGEKRNWIGFCRVQSSDGVNWTLVGQEYLSNGKSFLRGICRDQRI